MREVRHVGPIRPYASNLLRTAASRRCSVAHRAGRCEAARARVKAKGKKSPQHRHLHHADCTFVMGTFPDDPPWPEPDIGRPVEPGSVSGADKRLIASVVAGIEGQLLGRMITRGERGDESSRINRF